GRAPALLYLHGARVNLTSSVYRIRGYAQMGFNVLAIDYRGFGRSSERLPSEDSVYEDAEAAWRWLATRVPVPQRRVIFGHSLGGAIAVELALRAGDAGALVLESTFTSIREMAETRAAFLPIDGLITQHFEVEKKLPRVRMPVFIVHGEDDSVVPASMAARLYAAAPEPKRLFMVQGAGHRAPMRRAGPAFREALFDAACKRPALQTC
ncbi:MAG: alpha/beta fold hydrolase, partial [Proteobacteria bacterium]|nr:alpha/beta fold hydrolase [Pseudomonadota bacterium]